jgi:hypothetical protein
VVRVLDAAVASIREGGRAIDIEPVASRSNGQTLA